MKQSIAETEKVLVIWMEDQTSHNMPLSQNSIQNKVLTLFHSVKAERGKETAEGKCEASRGWSRGFRERSVSTTTTKKKKTSASADGKAAASHSEDLAKMIHESGYTK